MPDGEMETHTEIKSWYDDDFPFDRDDYTMKRVHEVLPDGYWLAEDLSTDGDIVLLRWDREVNDA